MPTLHDYYRGVDAVGIVSRANTVFHDIKRSDAATTVCGIVRSEHPNFVVMLRDEAENAGYRECGNCYD